MKRFWLSILLVPLIVAGVGSYYIQAAAHRMPEFVLQRQSGDEQAAARVSFQGAYGIREFRETVSIDAQGSEYYREKSLFDKLSSPDWGSWDLKRLIERYPQFMRGKREVRALYEDENRLAYANVKGEGSEGRRNFRFAVSVLDKKQDRTVSSYEAAVPNGKLYQQILVHDVQVVGEQLKVVTVNYTYNGQQEPHLYTLGLQSGQAPMDQTLPYEPSGSPDIETFLEEGYPSNAAEPSRYTVLYAMLTKKVKEADGSYSFEEMGGRLLVYDIRSGQEVKIDSQEISDFLSGGRQGHLIEHEGDSLYFAKQTGQGVTVIQYDIAGAKSVERSVQTGADLRFMDLDDRRLYMVTGSDQKGFAPPSLVIADVTTGSTIYQGTIALKEADRYPAETLNNLMIHGFTVK
jgi:hypothetical protein